MKEFREIIPWMYFKGIKDGDISVLFFEKVNLDEAKHGDLIVFHHLNESIKTYFDSAKLIAFKDVTNDVAKKAGFVNRELLSNHLSERFNIDCGFDFSTGSKIDKEIFYMVTITDDPVETVSDGEITLKMNVVPGTMIKSCHQSSKCCHDYWKGFSLNDEYEQKPWRN